MTDINRILSEFSNIQIKWDKKRELYYFSFYYEGKRYYRLSTKWTKRKKSLAEYELQKLITKLLENEDIAPSFNKRIDKITLNELKNFCKNLLNKKYTDKNGEHFYSNARLNKIQTELFSIFEYAYKNNYVKENLTDKIEKVRHNTIQKKKEFKLVPQADFETVINTIPVSKKYQVELKVALTISRYHGCRPSELLGLDIGHIDFKNKTILFKQTWDSKSRTLGPTKNKKERLNYTNDEVLNAIQEMLDYYKDYDYDNDTPLLGLTRFSRTTLDRYRLELQALSGVGRFHWYDLRHTHATELFLLGFSVTDIAERLGHDETETLNTYIIRDPKIQKEMLEKLQKSNKTV